MKIIYDGYLETIRINVLGARFDNWGKGEIRDINEPHASKLLENKDFKKVTSSEVKELPKEEKNEEISFDLDGDGDFDKDDMSIAGRAMAHGRKIKN